MSLISNQKQMRARIARKVLLLSLAFAVKGKHRGRYRLAGDAAPRIDAAITCCGEDVDMIMDTAAGTATQDNPPDCFRIFILDDGQSSTLCKAVEKYNQSGDILGQGGQTHSVVNDLVGPMTDDLGTVQCFGMGYIVRRAALEDIGGYPQVNFGEDVFCSHVLYGHGWGVAFLRENLQTGLAAGNFQAVLKQHMRWLPSLQGI
ncbi:hypothetical protein DL768_011493 [Monosporascus sp. mg162]|nr:hypothetical protein DL768_011493 [Monosporascus sp. mg162]